MTTDQVWAAPLATLGLDATVVIPGSKSLTNRYLPLAALAEEPTTITGALRSRDADLMIGALRSLGTTITIGEQDPTSISITPGQLQGGVRIDCGLAGTVMRFIPPIAALATGPVHLDGDAAARSRPMGPVLTALADLGVALGGEQDPPQFLPVTVHGAGAVAGGQVQIDAAASSQFVSALLLAAPRFTSGLTLRHVGSVLPSQPHIDMTVAALRERGVVVDDTTAGQWRVEPGPIAGGHVAVEPDLSNAAPFLAAALVAGGQVRIPHWPARTTQPGALLPEFLTAFGGQVNLDDDGVLTARGGGTLAPVDLDLSQAGELTPALAALAALAPGRSRLRGIAHLRGHETDRLAALVTEITRLGGRAEETEDGLIIDGGDLRPAVLRTYHDHRMAMFAAIIGLAVDGVGVVDVATTAKTVPGFATMWHSMLTGA
ncbi:3-phosphoshikimate 1-carboxyvinyltransferase [Pseudactinotalea sp. Z1732]|uniref:3-phosphoshikimate 1-carboxyvinyltransferase n=1 Tax=Pseudactinotalea sp. Z1732 TaxID=3413026 RepID=UPI003C7DF552